MRDISVSCRPKDHCQRGFGHQDGQRCSIEQVDTSSWNFNAPRPFRQASRCSKPSISAHTPTEDSKLPAGPHALCSWRAHLSIASFICIYIYSPSKTTICKACSDERVKLTKYRLLWVPHPNDHHQPGLGHQDAQRHK